MTKKPGVGGVIVVALALGIGAAVLLYQWASEQKKHSRENWKPVVVAAVDIKQHTKLTREMVLVTPTPQELIAEGTATRVEEVEGRVTLVAFHPKDQIRVKDLALEGQVPGLAFEVPSGMRAIAIEAGEVLAVGTRVVPGDHVDILATYHDPRTKQDLTKIFMQNVLVLAVNRGTDPSGKEGATTSMTLAVKPEQTELVTAASKAGALRVSLRAVNDDKIIPTEGTTVRDLGGGRMMFEEPTTSVPTNVTPPEPRSQPVTIIGLPARSRPEVTIIRGTEEKTVSPQ